MPRFKLTDELLSEVREIVFGPCTVVYETMTLGEIREDIENYLKQNRVYMQGEKKAIYTPGLTITNLKSWLLMRKDIEVWDVNPETPFDRTDKQIEAAKEVEDRVRRRLTTNISKFIERLRYANRPESGTS
jgi:hypothetical protein